MLFTQTKLQGSYIVEPEKLEDGRGFFARTWCQQEFSTLGLDANLVQCSISFNNKRGTLRGMHLQIPPCAETKLVRCTQGGIYDVIIDLRSHSSTYMQWTAVHLTAKNRKALYIPKGFAHGFQTLADNTEVFYQMSDFYRPDFARGFRWNDPNFKIQWPEPVTIISVRDREYEDFEPSWL
ncbi:dTDP-4-dehydrorhamnose 3,5-epimerase [Pseudanabaena sp. PCC 6802]|uniref:dTDP-4-dehydrorhamnose 3,5-epimerase n=1 Tax=Pseudanabaena sp. PCC 6802 TaxID=118173 RepID=UPI0003478B49|nr:dTDP-4-dehydrorhamnose 3,5-epimerase [Pseudanabaena sp. PCC 6802]